MGWGAMKGIGAALSNIGNKLMDDNLARMREERLRSYQVEDRDKDYSEQEKRDSANREFQTSERVGGQVFQAEQSGLNRELQATQFSEDLALRKQQVEKTIEQIDQTIESGRLELEESKRLQELRDVLIRDDASDIEKDSARQKLIDLRAESPEKYEFFTVFDTDEYGTEVRRTARGDRASGDYQVIGGAAFTPSSPASTAAAGMPSPKTKDEYDALPPGTRYLHPDGTTKVKGGR